MIFSTTLSQFLDLAYGVQILTLTFQDRIKLGPEVAFKTIF